MPTNAEVNSCPESVRRYFRAIGSKGGQAGKGSPLRKEISRRNAFKRWKAIRAAGGESWQKPKGRPKKKRPQRPPPKKKTPRAKRINIPAVVHQTPIGLMSQPVIGFK